MFEHLDRIEKLGFTITLNWNKSIDITLDNNPLDMRVLFCSFHSFSEPSYEDIVETACDFFYMWYNKNLKKINDYESIGSNFGELLDSTLGDITKQVYRDFNIDNLLY